MDSQQLIGILKRSKDTTIGDYLMRWNRQSLLAQKTQPIPIPTLKANLPFDNLKETTTA